MSVIFWHFAQNQLLDDSHSTPFPQKVLRHLHSMHIFLSGFCSPFPYLVFARIFRTIPSTKLQKWPPAKHPLLNRSIEWTRFCYTKCEHFSRVVSKGSSQLTSESQKPGHWSTVLKAQFLISQKTINLFNLSIYWCLMYVLGVPFGRRFYFT